MGGVLVLRATKKLRDRLGAEPPAEGEGSTTLLGDWYANVVPWRPHVAILVNARTLLPVLTLLAPAKTLPGRVADVIAAALLAQNVPPEVVAAEVEQMREIRVGPATDRSVLGSMKEFIFLAETRREDTTDLAAGLADGLAAGPAAGLADLSKVLAHVPCGPLYKSHVFPDAELAAVVAEHVNAHT